MKCRAAHPLYSVGGDFSSPALYSLLSFLRQPIQKGLSAVLNSAFSPIRTVNKTHALLKKPVKFFLIFSILYSNFHRRNFYTLF